MGITERLKEIGSKLKIIQTVDQVKADKPITKIKTKTVKLDDLKKEIDKDSIKILAEAPVELKIPFNKIFETAGIKPGPHGWTADKLLQLLQTEQFIGLDRISAQKAVLGVLSVSGATTEEIVADAIARDKAIDSFHFYLSNKLNERNGLREKEIEETQAQIQELENKIVTIDNEAKADLANLQEWINKKIEYEKGMARSVGVLVENQPVTVTEKSENKKDGKNT